LQGKNWRVSYFLWRKVLRHRGQVGRKREEREEEREGVEANIFFLLLYRCSDEEN
jgi:hypothetical protein